MAVLEIGSEADGRIAILTLNRPDARNALSIELCDAITEAIDKLEDDAEVRAIVLTGKGKVFCSGADFSAIAGRGPWSFCRRSNGCSSASLAPSTRRSQRSTEPHSVADSSWRRFAISASPVPTRSSASPVPRSGIVVNFENVQRLVVLAGVAVAKEVLMTGRTFTADSGVGQRLVTTTIDPRPCAKKRWSSPTRSARSRLSRFRGPSARSSRSWTISAALVYPMPPASIRSMNWSARPTRAGT